MAGALIIGLSTFQAEFDFGVPQFQLLYQPVLIAFAAAVALVCARSILGRWGAFRALAIYFVIRGGLALFVGQVAGYTTPHFPLYLAEAAIVELAALAAPRAPLRFAVLSGLGIGTVGLAAEWGWSHVWMPHPWPASMLAPAVLLALGAALAGSVLGARMSQSLACPRASARRCPRSVRGPSRWRERSRWWPSSSRCRAAGGDGTRAAIVPTPAGSGHVNVAVRSTRPPRRATTSGSRCSPGRAGRPGHLRQLTALRRVGPGRYVTERPVPVGGNWKTMLRLAKGTHLMALPVYLPPSPQAHRAGVPVAPRSGPMQSDTFILQREARGGPAG